MKGYIAVTDNGWYQHLRGRPGPQDANFWRPSTRAFRLDVGTPFLFKLKAPNHAIAGFGYFAGFSILPDWLAWDTFAEANGVGTLGELQGKLSKIQKGAGIEGDPGGRIGCCLIAEATFFDPNEWVAPPNDWKRNIQTGSGYDLSAGEGLRVWTECLQRVAGRTDEAPASHETEARYGKPTQVVPRLGQGIFRVSVLDAYDRACAVTQEHSLPVLDAAHIVPYASGGQHLVSNGLSLRSDLHRLFDRGYVTVDENHRFIVGRRLRDDFDNGRSYYKLHGTALTLPDDPRLHPSNASLEWHRTGPFLG
jgi:putative restriction endonuclease